jgi:hypothetical protein
MVKRRIGYEKLLKDVVEAVKNSPEELNQVMDTSSKVMSAANEMTKDEIALISAYLKSDLKEFAEEFEESKKSPFYLMIADSIWETLFSASDKTKVEWVELLQEVEHQGVYHVGDLIGLGELICDHCGHKTAYNHPTEITPCIKCEGAVFSRIHRPSCSES